MRRRSPILLSLLAASVLLCSRPVGAQEEACALPAPLRAALQERFGTSRVLTLSDLYDDEKAVFRREYKGACPGAASGAFFGAGERPATALVLLGVGPKKDIRLVVARPALATYILVEVDRLDAGATAVVSAKRRAAIPELPAGTGREMDAVLLTALETWQRAYLWNGRAFDKSSLSE